MPGQDKAAEDALRPVTLKQMIGLAPDEAIRFLDAKGYQTSVNWDEVYQEEHVPAFTAAKIAKIDLLREIHISLLDAQAAGTPFAQWKAELQPALERAGWWGKVTDSEVTGTERTVTIGPRRLRTIYDTNLRMARATALWDRVQASKSLLPYLRYSAVLDGRTRPLHRAWHGTILPVDHPWWQTHFPPNGWNCRCTVIQLSEAMMTRRGWKVTDPAPPLDDLVPFYRRSTGERLEVPRGVDPGFAYSPGRARAQAAAEKVAQSLIAARNAGLQLDEAAIAELLRDTPGMRATPDAAAAVVQLLGTGEVGAIAAMLLDLITGGMVASATLILDGLIAAASRRRRRNNWRSKLKGNSYAHGGRPDQKRDHGRFANEGRDAQRLASTHQWVADTIKPGAIQTGKHFLGTASSRTVSNIEAATGRVVSERAVVLDHGHTIHIMRHHGSQRETLRGQVPITAYDLHQTPTLLDRAHIFARAFDRRGEHEGSVLMATFEADLHGFRYFGIVDLTRSGVLLRDLWKKK